MNWILDTLHIVFTEANANRYIDKKKKNISSAWYQNVEYRAEREELAPVLRRYVAAFT